MIYETSKPLKNATKEELILLLKGQQEAVDRLVKLLESEWDKKNSEIEDERYPFYESPEKQAFLEGFEFCENIVRNFYERPKE